MTNTQLSATGTGDGSCLIVAKGDGGTNVRFGGSGRELRSERGDTSTYASAARSRESNGRFGVIED